MYYNHKIGFVYHAETVEYKISQRKELVSYGEYNERKWENKHHQ